MNTLMPKVVVLAGLLAVAGGAMAGAGGPVSWSGSSDDGAAREVIWTVNKPSPLTFTITTTDITSVAPQTINNGEAIGTWKNSGEAVEVRDETQLMYGSEHWYGEFAATGDARKGPGGGMQEVLFYTLADSCSSAADHSASTCIIPARAEGTIRPATSNPNDPLLRFSESGKKENIVTLEGLKSTILTSKIMVTRKAV